MVRFRHSRSTALLSGMLLVSSALSGGCASFSNPTAHEAIPVHRLPPEVFGRPREEEKTIPLTLLRQKQEERYTLDAGDVLGIWVSGILSDERNPAPTIIQLNPYSLTGDERRLPPAVGTPFVIQDNGNITLPLIDPINVRGKTLSEVERIVKDAYVKADIIKKDKTVLVTLAKQRTYHVTVIRQDGGGVIVSGAGQLVNSRRGTGVPLDLPAGDNDVLTALARSGGLPGLDASNTVVVQRGDPPSVVEGTTVAQASASQQQIRIPLRMRDNEPLPFRPEDIILKTGDIVFIESRETELYYTGGLLPVGEFILPRDYDLDVLEAVTQSHGPLLNGGINFNNLNGNIFSSGLGFPSPSLLTVIRKTPGCGQIVIRVDLNRAAVDPRERVLVKPGDFLILQETTGESFTRYVTQTFRFTTFFRFINQTNAQAALNSNFP
jgi:protein involved in polysaccharide export with SLBB domain